jgi:hypothetical protein
MLPDGNVGPRAERPSVVYNTTANQYLVVWRALVAAGDGFEVYGRIHAANGTPVGGQFRISDMGPDGSPLFNVEDIPDVTYNSAANEYLVVWAADDDAGTVDNELEIYAQRISAAGAEVGTNDVRISDAGGLGNTTWNAREPAVAYNATANEYMVVWRADDDAAGTADDENEVFGQRLAGATAAEVGTNDVRLSDMGPNANPNFDALSPDVAANPTSNEYMVTWEGDDDTGTLVDGETEIYGQRVSASGAEVGTNDVRLSDMGADGNANFDANDPAVTHLTRTNEYLVAWEGEDDTGALVDAEHEIYVQRVTATGVEAGNNDVRVSDAGPDGNAQFDAVDPDVVANPVAGEYLVVWEGDDDVAPAVLDDEEIFGQRLTSAAVETGTNDFRISKMGPDPGTTYEAFNPAVAFGATPNQYFVAWEGDDNTAPLIDGEFEIYARLNGAGPPLSTTEVCKPITPTPAPAGDPSKVTLSTAQLLINQRISQAAVLRANAINKWLEDGVTGSDLCGGTLAPADFGQGVVLGAQPNPPTPAQPSPRAITPGPVGGGNPAAVQLTRDQLLINQRISQAAVRRVNALKARLDGGLTGGDLVDGAITREKLADQLGVLAAPTPVTTTPKTTTNVAPATPGNPSAVTLSKTQLLINQRISQAAVRRSNELRDRLRAGLKGTDFQDGTLTANDISAAAKP